MTVCVTTAEMDEEGSEKEKRQSDVLIIVFVDCQVFDYVPA